MAGMLLSFLVRDGGSFVPNVIVPTRASSARNEGGGDVAATLYMRPRETTADDELSDRPSSSVVGRASGTGRRLPQNKHIAIRWVVQGVERCLAMEDGEVSGREGGCGSRTAASGGGGKSYRRMLDASLVDVLYLLANARDQRDVLDAELRLGILMQDQGEFPAEVNERVIKATAMAGLASMSSSLLNDALLRNNATAVLVPSPMAYTAVLNALRRIGRIDGMEQTLMNLAGACKRASEITGKTIGVDVVAFNAYLAALCDAAVNDSPFSFPSSDVIDDDEYAAFNFTSLSNSSTTSSSDGYLYKALNLLGGDVARRKFALETDPDGYSYNQVLNAAAKCCSKVDNDNRIATSIMTSCLRGMTERGIQADILTYNARLQAALFTDGEEAAIELYEQILSDPNVAPDRYTINFMLRPFVCARRLDDIWTMLNNFYEKNVEENTYVVSSAFEAFLITLVDMGEIELSRDIFQTFFLKMPKKQTKRMQLSKMVHVMNSGDQPRQNAAMSLVDSVKMKSNFQASVQPNTLLPPKTRHFNILLGGYSKAYHSVITKVGRSLSLVSNKDDQLKDPWTVSSATLPNIQNAFELLEIMLRIGVPLDSFSVSSLMALPYPTSEDITSLLLRIEPEMMVELNPAAYRSVIAAFGKVNDPSSAFWMFEEMTHKCRNQGRNVESWNAILGALAKGCKENDNGYVLDILNSNVARVRRRLQSQESKELESRLIDLVDGYTCLDASFKVLNTMRNGTVLSEGFAAPKPNSQAYCQVASALSGSGASRPSIDLALALFRNATEEGVAADGRFLNAVLRCFGDDIEAALAAWKRHIGPAAAGYERTSRKRGANVLAAYNGLMHVCGRAIRPDIATRIVYAMKKSGYEPTEVSLNSYLAGKRITLNGSDGDKNIGLSNQYETALFLECTKYNAKDRRRANDKKIRIIL
jgi:pentatricopeptide repeat protein